MASQTISSIFIFVLSFFALNGKSIAAKPVEQLQASAGGTLYENHCARCHDNGVLNAPEPRSEALHVRYEVKGYDGLWSSLLNGRARMPKKGGCFNCSEDDLKLILEYMLSEK